MIRSGERTVALLAAVVLLFAGCQKRQSEQEKSDVGFGSTGGVAGIRWSVPKRWSELGAKPMRVATYGIPAAEGDQESAECAVYFFGAGQGGTVDQNVDRWVGQFENPSTPSRSTKDVNGIAVTLVKVGGTYLGMEGMQSTDKKQNYQLLGAIINAPQGWVFFKCTGPEKTVASAEAEFNAMTGSLSKE